MSKRERLIALNAAQSIHRAALCSLARSTEDWLSARRPAEAQGLAGRLGVPQKALQRAIALRTESPRLAALELERTARLGIDILVLGDADYPAELLDHPLPPPVLYCRGRLPDGPRIAIVGSRKMTSYGREVAQRFAGHLAAAGLVVVSGFALGVDAVAHRTALAVAGGKTVAVLGCGLDIDYPKGHRELADGIAEHGAILSEFPLGCPPLPWQFPIRNRVIAALSRGTLVVQAAQRSGSLITAHLALELGRDVYAVPGAITDPLALGTNRLIADGAIPALEPDDLLHGLPLSEQMVLFPSTKTLYSTKTLHSTNLAATALATSQTRAAAPGGAAPATTTPTIPRPTGFAGKLLDTFRDDGERSAEDLAQELCTDVNRILASLLELELGGWVVRLPGPSYRRAASTPTPAGRHGV